MLVRIANIFLIAAMLAAANGHWAVLQSVAWTTMLADNLHHDSFTEAVQCTFDGKHPCCLCKAIAAGKKSEKKNEFTAQNLKFEFLLSGENPVPIAPTSFRLLAQPDSFAESLPNEPQTPPPRGSLA